MAAALVSVQLQSHSALTCCARGQGFPEVVWSCFVQLPALPRKRSQALGERPLKPSVSSDVQENLEIEAEAAEEGATISGREGVRVRST